MSFYGLLHHIAHGYPGKVPALASDMGKVSGSLLNKLNPNNNDAHINPHEIEEMTDLANANAQVARYFADKANLLLIPMLQIEGSDVELLDGTLDLFKELGEFCTEFQSAYADGRIDRKDFKRVHKEGTDVLCKMATLMDRIGQMVDDKATLRSARKE